MHQLAPLPFAAALSIALLVGTSAVEAQITFQPTPPPVVTAEREAWYQEGRPITFEGHFYHPAGPAVFFDGRTMVRTGFFRGVPLYASTTIEPASIVFVPVAGGRLQPYERRRANRLAGTTGSRAPSFPVQLPQAPAEWQPDAWTDMPPPEIRRAPGPPTHHAPHGPGHASLYQSRSPAPYWEDYWRLHAPAQPPSAHAGDWRKRWRRRAPPREERPAEEEAPRGLQSIPAPTGVNAIWVEYEGVRWYSAGRAVPRSDERFQQIGDYRGFPVYAERGDRRPARIYVPSFEWLLAPYERR